MAPPPFLAVVGACALSCALPFAISRAAARRRGPQPRRRDTRPVSAGWFAAGCGFGQLTMAYAVATELRPDLADSLRYASTLLAAAATVIALQLAGWDLLDDLALLSPAPLRSRRGPPPPPPPRS